MNDHRLQTFPGLTGKSWPMVAKSAMTLESGEY